MQQARSSGCRFRISDARKLPHVGNGSQRTGRVQTVLAGEFDRIGPPLLDVARLAKKLAIPAIIRPSSDDGDDVIAAKLRVEMRTAALEIRALPVLIAKQMINFGLAYCAGSLSPAPLAHARAGAALFWVCCLPFQISGALFFWIPGTVVRAASPLYLWVGRVFSLISFQGCCVGASDTYAVRLIPQA